jgi:hypothetical protein
MISSIGYHVPKPIMEPCCLGWRLVALGEHVELLFKGFLVPITLLIAGRVFQKTMFPRHLRINAMDASCVFRVSERCIKFVVLPIGLKEPQSLFCGNM